MSSFIAKTALSFTNNLSNVQWPALGVVVSQPLPKHSVVLLISLIVYLMDYEELPDDSSISFLSLHDSLFSLQSFSQGHNSVSQHGNVQGGYCPFSYCILMQYVASVTHVETPGLQKKKTMDNFIYSHVLPTTDKLKL